MFEAITLGIIQGVAEWLPISSSALVSLVSIQFFGGGAAESVSMALFLHAGTFFAALIYYRADVLSVLRGAYARQQQSGNAYALLRFLSISVFISLCIAGILYVLGERFLLQLESSGRFLTGVIGVLLVFTGIMQIRFRQKGERTVMEHTKRDAVLLGVAQGIAVIPGVSRSGITIATLLFRQFSEREALRLSFLMSLPIVFIGNIALQFSGFAITKELLLGAVTAFVFGLLTIHVLVRVARHALFGYLALLFGVFSLVAVLV